MQTLKHALAAPGATVSGWLATIATCYPSLWDKNGAGIFKLDAWIYYHAVAQWYTGGSLYDWYANPTEQLWPFTYPPFAASVLSLLTLGSDRGAQVLLVVLTPLCTAAVSWATLRVLGADRQVARGAAPWLATAGVMTLEPLPKTMEYGQVNAVLMALVALDLLVVPERSRWRGALSGLAAAFKLTPAIAIIVLLVRRELRAAATLAGTAAAVTALTWAVWPQESAVFFGSAMWDPGRAGFADYAGNQNLKGLVARWLPESAWTPVWAVCALAVVVGTVLVLLRLAPGRWRRQEAPPPAEGRARTHDAGLELLLGVVVTMTSGLLISPISWSHHWVWCLPLLVGLAEAARRWEAPALWVTTAVGAVVFTLAMHWWFPEQNHVEQDWPVWATVVGSSYTLFSLGAGAVLWRECGRRQTPRDDGVAGDRAVSDDGASHLEGPAHEPVGRR